MTWILGKLGLTLLDGKTLMPIAAVLAAAAALMAAGLYAVSHFTAAGYEKAVAECNVRDVQANTDKADHQTALREASREVIIRHTADTAKVAAAATTERREVKDDIQTNPAPAGCALSPVGLRLWNRTVVEDRAAGLPGGFGPADEDRRRALELAGSAGWRLGFTPGKPDGFETSVRPALPVGAGPVRASQAVPAATDARAQIGAR